MGVVHFASEIRSPQTDRGLFWRAILLSRVFCVWSFPPVRNDYVKMATAWLVSVRTGLRQNVAAYKQIQKVQCLLFGASGWFLSWAYVVFPCISRFCFNRRCAAADLDTAWHDHPTQMSANRSNQNIIIAPQLPGLIWNIVTFLSNALFIKGRCPLRECHYFHFNAVVVSSTHLASQLSLATSVLSQSHHAV